MKKFDSLLEIDIIRNYSPKIECPGGGGGGGGGYFFLGFGCPSDA